MSESKKKDAAARIRYEPPALLDLGSGVAYAQNPHCRNGGSPGGTICQAGSVAAEAKCQPGSAAGAKCQGGSVAAGGKCQGGSVPSGKCSGGASP